MKTILFTCAALLSWSTTARADDCYLQGTAAFAAERYVEAGRAFEAAAGEPQCAASRIGLLVSAGEAYRRWARDMGDLDGWCWAQAAYEAVLAEPDGLSEGVRAQVESGHAEAWEGCRPKGGAGLLAPVGLPSGAADVAPGPEGRLVEVVPFTRMGPTPEGAALPAVTAAPEPLPAVTGTAGPPPPDEGPRAWWIVAGVAVVAVAVGATLWLAPDEAPASSNRLFFDLRADGGAR